MEQKYSIKGIEKIIETAGKEKLAKYYGVDIDADFENIIISDFKEHNIPNGLEVALYFSLSPEEYNKAFEEGRVPRKQDAALKIYEQDERQRAMFGFNYIGDMPQCNEDDWSKMTGGSYGNVLYFFVDKPVKIEKIGDYMYSPRYMVGGVQYYGLMMGNGYYKEHEKELEQSVPDRSKIEAVEGYVKKNMDQFENAATLGEHGPKPEYEEIARAEKIILDMTGKSSIDELSLQDFITLKKQLEKEERDLQREFEDKFIGNENEERE